MDDAAACEALSAVFSSDEIAAALDYTARRDRRQHPTGRFDSAGCFELSERSYCCIGLRAPTRRFPLSEMHHGRTALHCATIHGADVAAVRDAARILDYVRSASTTTGHQRAAAARTLGDLLTKAEKKQTAKYAKAVRRRRNLFEAGF